MVLSGCSNFYTERRYSNPEINRLQLKSLHGLSGTPIQNKSIAEFFHGNVGFIISDHGDPESVLGRRNWDWIKGSGRGTPISEDGYFLTAAHVVDDETPYLFKHTRKKEIPKGVTIFTNAQDHFQKDAFMGRVVWSNQEIDLAIVKFKNFTTKDFIDSWPSEPRKNELVIAGSTEGHLLVLENNQLIGNGAYQTAGKVTSFKKVIENIPIYQVHTTLVGRAGMSGGPAVYSDGSLAGIIIEMQTTFGFTGFKVGTALIAPPKNFIYDMINKDRMRSVTEERIKNEF